ncbi:MAG TPA: sigma factor [Vicinamibacterales bacterium]|nr:sigma factor [Vicinamibacterales bacterium]
MSTPEHAPDDELMPRIAGGDREAFAALYRRRRLDVYRFALHMTASAANADDVTQEVFVAVIVAAARYVPGRSGVVPWLLDIARNHVRRGARWNRLRVSSTPPKRSPRGRSKACARRASARRRRFRQTRSATICRS